jgi:ADP-dependent phosphofructokinase/glucokinase
VPTANDWPARFAAALAAAERRLRDDFRVACGYTNNVDVVIKLDDEARRTLAEIDPRGCRGAVGELPERIDTPGDVVNALLHHMRAGTGDVIGVGSAEMAGWLEAHFPPSIPGEVSGGRSLQLGGAGAQAANTLAHLGYRALVHVTALSAVDASVFSDSDRLVVATPDGLRPLAQAVRPGDRPMYHHVLEFQTGDHLNWGGTAVVAPRANRIILIYDPVNERLPIDPLFFQAIADPAARVSRAMITGFSVLDSVATSHARMAVTLEHLREVRRMRPELLFHGELACVSDPALIRPIVDELAPRMDSVGGNEQEVTMAVAGWQAPPPDAVEDRLALLAELRARLAAGGGPGPRRVNLHTQDYCLTLTDFDPRVEQDALLFAALVSGTRARLGKWPRMEDPRRTLDEGGQPGEASRAAEERLKAALPLDAGVGRCAGTDLVFAPTLSVSHPAGTVGLGDSFTGGVLVMMGR